MTAVLYVLACAVFCAVFLSMGVMSRAQRLLALLSEAARILRNSELSDADKERIAQTTGLSALRLLVGLLAGLVTVAAATMAPVWLAASIGLAEAADVLHFALDPLVLVGTCVVIGGLLGLWRRSAGAWKSG